MSSNKLLRGNVSAHPQLNLEGLSANEKKLFTDQVKVETKTIQLCRQIEEAISSALACSTSPVLRDAYVLAVDPLKGAASLSVLISSQQEGDDPIELTKALERATNYLRGEVARAITRKRVPTLKFVIAPTSSRDEEVVDEQD